jgi:hypothetical protein
MKRPKLTMVTLIAITLMSLFQVSLGIAWLQVTMLPENADGPIELGVVTGGELIPVLAALTPVMWLGIIVALLLKNRVWIGYGILSILGFASLMAVAGYNLSGDTAAVSDQLMGWQNVAAAHDVTDLQQVRTFGEWFALAGAILVALGFAVLSFYAFKQRLAAQSEARAKPLSESLLSEKATAESDRDPISLWDDQRRGN